ncbi:MAG: DUF2029 domain-containing protein [Oscillatoriales cyanobacterium C42_A2020_001]|nr:DUF2029 domain-containing protein [Leptolyngbyaceae cyanobacterium C42_A2020_001]
MKSLIDRRHKASSSSHQVRKRDLLVPIVILTLSLGLMLATGLLGVGRQGGFAASNADVIYFYMSAKAWLSGLNPYDYETFQKLAQPLERSDVVPFAYPPHSFVLGGFLSIFPYSVAKVLMAVLNLVCVVVIAVLGVRLVQMREDAAGVVRSRSAGWVIPTIVFANPFTSHVLWTGQTALLVGVAAIAGWILVNRGLWLVGGILIGFATFKPQLTVLIVLWLVFERRWRVLTVVGLSALLFSLVPLVSTGVADTLSGWLRAMSDYKGTPGMTPGTGYIIGISSVVKALGIDTSKQLTIALTVLGAFPLTFYLFRQRRWAGKSDILGLLLALPILFVYAHDYDLAILVPLVASFCWYLRSRPLSQLIALGLMIVLFIPYRLISRLDPPVLFLHWRTFVLGAIVTWLFLLVVRNRNQADSLTHQNHPVAGVSLK